MPATMENITVSIPSRLVAVVEEIVKENKTNRSRVISQCLEEYAQKRMDKLMEIGYKTMAKEQKEMAGLSFKLQSSVVPDWE